MAWEGRGGALKKRASLPSFAKLNAGIHTSPVALKASFSYNREDKKKKPFSALIYKSQRRKPRKQQLCFPLSLCSAIAGSGSESPSPGTGNCRARESDGSKRRHSTTHPSRRRW